MLFKKLGLLVVFVSLSYLMFDNFITYFFTDIVLINYKDWLILSFCLLMLGTVFIPRGDIAQVILLFISSTISFFITQKIGYGLSQVIVLGLFVNRYNFLKRGITLKITVFIIYYFIIIYFSNREFLKVSMHNTHLLFYYFIIVGSIIILKLDEIKSDIKKEIEVREIKKKLKKIQEYREHVEHDYLDPREFSLTNAEFIILRYLCLYNESNSDLASRLGKSVNTVKVQMKKVLIKSGAESRHQLIDLCREYFIRIEQQE